MELGPNMLFRPAERLAYGVVRVGRAALEAIDDSSRQYLAQSEREFHARQEYEEKIADQLRNSQKIL